MSDNSNWKESISLEETNKIRVSLGLKPISDAPSASKTADDLAQENFDKRKAADAASRDSTALQARIDKARNAKERARKLGGIGLGEAEVKIEGGKGDDENDTKGWVKKQKRRQKELAEKRARELDEMERRAAEEEGKVLYGEDDLKGIKVAHGEDDFEEGEETVLTLKDSRILDDEDDELHNLSISEHQQTAEALALKKKGRQAGQYTGYDDDEFDPDNIGGKRGVLSKYDEEIEGKGESGFRLGAMPVAKPKAGGAKGKGREDEVEEKEKVKLSMDYAKSFTNDYLQEGEAGFKVKKKKKRAPGRVTTLADDDLASATAASADAMEVDSTPAPRLGRANFDETNLIDDDDLQASLARSRRDANRKKIEEMKARAAKRSTEGADGMDVDRVKSEPVDDDENEDDSRADDVLIMDDTSEFVRNIQIAAARPPMARTNGTATVVKQEEKGVESVVPVIKAEPEDVPLAELGGDISRGGWGPAREDGEESDDDMAYVGGDDIPAPDVKEEDVKPSLGGDGDDAIGGTSGEVLVSRGMASTLSLLRHQGLIVPRTPEELERDRVQKERAAWLALQRKRDREREEERIANRLAGSSKDQQQREYENKMREQRHAQEAMEAFKDYKPNVNLTYHDEFGRDQTPKEAWKQLSHSFHGKTSGSKKTEKRLKKIADEQKSRAMASGDTPLSTASAFAARAERMGTATMVLSVGNKGSAPTQEAVLGSDNKNLSKRSSTKPSTSRTERQPSATPVFNDIPMRALPLTDGGSHTPSSRDDSPAVGARPGFAPVRGFAPVANEAAGGGGGGGEKLAIPMSVKRKAKEEALGGPASKK